MEVEEKKQDVKPDPSELLAKQKKLKPEIKALWLTALRDDRFQQGQFSLRRMSREGAEFKYCCLGVASELFRTSEANANKIEWERVEKSTYHSFGGCHSLLNKEVIEWMGASGAHCAFVRVSDEIRQQYSLFEAHIFSIAELNDRGVSFSDIANIIEENL